MTSKTLLFSSLLSVGASLSLLAQDEIKFNVPSGTATPPSAGATAPAAPAPANTPAAAQPAQQFSEAQLLEMFGWFLGVRAGLPELEFPAAKVEEIVKGLRTAARGEPAPYDGEAIGPSMQRFMNENQAAFNEKLRQRGQEQSNALMAEVRKKAGVQVAESGLAFEIVEPGTGEKPKPDSVVRINYTGMLADGSVFDSSLPSNEPAELSLENTLPGFAEGLQKIGTGGKIRLYLPPELAYGDGGAAPSIPPAAALVFDVELLEVKPPVAATPEPAAPAATQQK